jgi:YD repeat-containing protein
VNGVEQTAYSYDANGNRLALADTNPANAATYGIAANSNRLLSTVTGTGATATASAFTYDATGNTLSDGEHLFTYDARGRMSTAFTPNTNAANNPNNNPNKGKAVVQQQA